MVQQLPGLPIGTAFVWSPQWLRILGRYAIRKKRTFDASATPDFSTKATGHEPVALAGKDLEALRTAMVEVVKKAEASDPKVLRKRITELEASVRKLESAPKPALLTVNSPKAREIPVLKESQIKRIEAVAARLDSHGAKLREAAAEILEALGCATPKPAPAVGLRQAAREIARSEMAIGRTPAADAARLGRAASGDRTLKRGARKMLQALASLDPKPLSRSQVATLAGISPSSGTFTSYLSDLRGNGFINENGNGLAITETGIEFLAGDWPDAPSSTEALVSLWSSKLKAGARRMLDALVDIHPRGVSRSILGERAGIEPTSGTFTSYLSDLRRNGLIEEDQGQVAAADTLFIGGSGQ
jgi:predicted transcriptional regulator